MNDIEIRKIINYYLADTYNNNKMITSISNLCYMLDIIDSDNRWSFNSVGVAFRNNIRTEHISERVKKNTLL
jgi:hypothetical protein